MSEGNVPVVKLARSIEALCELMVELIGLVIVYVIFEFVGKSLISNFQSDMLLSLVVLPAIYVLRDLHTIFAPFFVKIVLHEDTITVESGILTRRLDCLNLQTVENIELITTLLGRFIGYSTLTIYAYGSWVQLPNVKSPEEVKAKIEASITKRSNKDAAKLPA
jgi:uncharacterized membrane protein YdbT with pleckstrin-like domain